VKTVAVIGAGISGLAFAHRLQELADKDGSPLEIAVLEEGSETGGVVSTETRDGFLLENGPDAFLSDSLDMMDLCRELGVEDELIGTQPAHRRTFVVHHGKLHPLPEGFHLIAPKNIPAFLKTSLFSPAGKLRMLAELFVPRSDQRDESVASFVRRRFGHEALERVGQPMIAGIYSGDPEELSMRSTMSRFCEAEDKHGSVIKGLSARAPARGVRYGLFVSFKNGMSTLTDVLASKLPASSLRTGFKASSVVYDYVQKWWTVTSEEGERIHADAVCLAVPARMAAEWLQEEFPGIARPLSEITYQSVATLNLAFNEGDMTHPLDGFGFVVPRTEKRSLMACTFVHRKFAGRVPQGKILLRAFVGGAFGQDTYSLPDRELENAVLDDLGALLGLRGKPLFSSLRRHSRALPQYRVGHKAILRRIEAEKVHIPHLALTGSSYRGTGIPDCVQDAYLRAERLWGNLKG